LRFLSLQRGSVGQGGSVVPAETHSRSSACSRRTGLSELLKIRVSMVLSLRLPPEVIANWKATGPGWQTRMAEVLEKSTPKARRSSG